MLKEFRAFAIRGNVIDLAVAVMIGAAFGQITTSLVNDVVMPPLGLIIGELDFSELYIDLSRTRDYATLSEARAAGVPTMAYGLFINAVVNFLIIAAVLFFVVRQINRIRARIDAGEAAPPAPATKSCGYCLSTIPAAASRCPQCTSHLPEAEALARSP